MSNKMWGGRFRADPDAIMEDIQRIKVDARNGTRERPRWPMIVLRTPKGWTCPKEIDGRRTEDYWRSHQVPMGEMHEKPEHVHILEQWMNSYRPAELFDESGRLRPELGELSPRGERRMSANPHTNGGLLLRDLRLPDFRDYAVDVPTPGATSTESTRRMGAKCRDPQADPGRQSGPSVRLLVTPPHAAPTPRHGHPARRHPPGRPLETRGRLIAVVGTAGERLYETADEPHQAIDNPPIPPAGSDCALDCAPCRAVHDSIDNLRIKFPQADAGAFRPVHKERIVQFIDAVLIEKNRIEPAVRPLLALLFPAAFAIFEICESETDQCDGDRYGSHTGFCHVTVLSLGSVRDR